MKMDMGSGSALGASAAFDAHGRLWLVSARGEHVVLQHAADPGTPLGTPVVVNAKPEAVYATGENRPKIVFGPAGEVYVQWTEKPAAGWVGDVRFARSSDGGKTFAAPITVNHDTALATRGFDSLAVAGNGDVVSAWIDGRDSVAAKAAGKPYAG
ncbi:MAG: exo-alpha-sialidase, partial [Rhodanobacter sp.]